MLKFVLILTVCAVVGTTDEPNNVCETYKDYENIDQEGYEGCRYNKDVNTDMPDLLTNNGYDVETHEAITDDGYILTMFRIKHETPKGVVYLQHPSLCSCTIWVDKEAKCDANHNCKEKSLGRLLNSEGYEVWLGNFRGTFYSRRHKTLSPESVEFWDYSFHELGDQDIVAQINKIKEVLKIEGSLLKDDKIIYAAQSMGGTAAAIYAALHEKHALANVKGFVLMAPATFMKNVQTPIKALAPISNGLYNLLKQLNLLEFLPRTPFMRDMLMKVCSRDPLLMKVCMVVLQLYVGPDKTFQDPSQIPVMFSQSPAGLSAKCFVHYGQFMHNKGEKFSYFDYGEKGNLEKYNQTTPLNYVDGDTKLKSKMYLIYGTSDYLVSPAGVQEFSKYLDQDPHIYEKSLPDVSHLHFLYGTKLDEVNKVAMECIDALQST